MILLLDRSTRLLLSGILNGTPCRLFVDTLQSTYDKFTRKIYIRYQRKTGRWRSASYYRLLSQPKPGVCSLSGRFRLAFLEVKWTQAYVCIYTWFRNLFEVICERDLTTDNEQTFYITSLFQKKKNINSFVQLKRNAILKLYTFWYFNFPLYIEFFFHNSLNAAGNYIYHLF